MRSRGIYKHEGILYDMQLLVTVINVRWCINLVELRASKVCKNADLAVALDIPPSVIDKAPDKQ